MPDNHTPESWLGRQPHCQPSTAVSIARIRKIAFQTDSTAAIKCKACYECAITPHRSRINKSSRHERPTLLPEAKLTTSHRELRLRRRDSPASDTNHPIGCQRRRPRHSRYTDLRPGELVEERAGGRPGAQERVDLEGHHRPRVQTQRARVLGEISQQVLRAEEPNLPDRRV